MEQKPWLKHYDEGVPHSLKPYPEKTLVDVMQETAKQKPEHIAMIFKGTELTYRELDQLTNAMAAAFAELGVKKGSRVAAFLPNSPQAIITQFAVWKAGGVAVPLNPLYTEREMEQILNAAGAETTVVLTPFYDKVKKMQSRTKLRNVIASNIKEFLPGHLRFLFTLLKEKKEGHRIQLQDGDYWFGDLLKKYEGAGTPATLPSPKDDALLLFTGGTTGTPKAALGTHHHLLMSGMQISSWFQKHLVPWRDSLLLTMPLFHVYGNAGVFATGIVGRNPLALIPNPRDLDDILATVKKVKPAFLPGVPTLFIALLNHPQVKAGKVDFSSMKACISGAAPLLLETKKRFEAVTGGRVVEGYALTESMMAAVITPMEGTYKEGAVGIPAPDVEIRIADADTGEGSLPPGEVGEILMRAPQLMKEYWKNPDETANTIKDGWLHTGDLGYLDEDGYLFIVDRKKDLIKPSGFQVWPREVEDVIAQHPAVAEVSVAGVMDEKKGEVVKAWIVLREGQQATAEDIQNFCRENLVGYKVPKQVEFREALPKTLVGKVLRRELVREHQEKHATS